jgi:hypothetical protein
LKPRAALLIGHLRQPEALFQDMIKAKTEEDER